MTSTIISAVLIWSGDFSARLQFNGPITETLKADFLDQNEKGEPFQSNKSCDIKANFKEVVLREKSRNEKHLKIIFNFVCDQKKISLPAQFARLSDLKLNQNLIYISDQYLKNNLKIESFSIETTQKKKK